MVIDVDVDANATSCYDNNNATTNARCAKMKLCCNLQWALEHGCVHIVTRALKYIVEYKIVNLIMPGIAFAQCCDAEVSNNFLHF